MKSIYKNIESSILKGEKLLAVLIDPDKMKLEQLSGFMLKLNQSVTTHVFIGGSRVNAQATDNLVKEVKKYTHLPIVLFPGDVNQISDQADALLYLSLISGRNPEYLIGKHVLAIPRLLEMDLEIIPTGYLLIDGGKKTAVESVTATKSLPQENTQDIINTAKAGEFLGMKLIYLEAGSGANIAVAPEIISSVKAYVDIPIIVGGGIRTKQQLDLAYKNGADLVVIGTAFEEDDSFFDELKK
ncbi:geranylgeranylglyceryl/heptaprenylglyceryl phosphate synthase [Seonamhaeicola sp. ML3]|uniref:geranylgeranylglyceryl/heptaprenylglyceryl phosphate synthase n=1 Tax=Seonamhaeicola sp. ML3 TaxID=2937786 RepID=UPI00200CE57E|nr:geranylgeranylglyceryl/heptaprenylglyceryl phosphate synthase [Seonamhaeicola sp. ML3]